MIYLFELLALSSHLDVSTYEFKFNFGSTFGTIKKKHNFCLLHRYNFIVITLEM